MNDGRNGIMVGVILLVITGTMGSGKTSVLAEASDILKSHRIAHVAIDLDALGGAYLPGCAQSDGTMYANLASISQNYAKLGLSRFLIARAVESRAELNCCCQAIGGTETIVCRLVGNHETIKRRVAEREQGMFREQFVWRVSTLDQILDKAAIEDFCVSTENRTVTDIAREVLIRARWISK